MFERYGDIQVMVTSPLLKKGQMKKDVKLQYLNSVRNAYKAYDYIFITDAAWQYRSFFWRTTKR